VAYMARVSNPSNQDNKATNERLIRYLISHDHWSPFEMVNACVEIQTTRDVGRQLLRHRSFSFQEFSGRYAAYSGLETARELRLQDHTNRQSSLRNSDVDLQQWWESLVGVLRLQSLDAYRSALSRGVAKEVARALLPEGLVPSNLYMNGNLRSWIHYWRVRCTPETQKEHRLIAESTRDIILPLFPNIEKALENVR